MLLKYVYEIRKCWVGEAVVVLREKGRKKISINGSGLLFEKLLRGEPLNVNAKEDVYGHPHEKDDVEITFGNLFSEDSGTSVPLKKASFFQCKADGTPEIQAKRKKAAEQRRWTRKKKMILKYVEEIEVLKIGEAAVVLRYKAGRKMILSGCGLLYSKLLTGEALIDPEDPECRIYVGGADGKKVPLKKFLRSKD
jgi:hypothetical protein